MIEETIERIGPPCQEAMERARRRNQRLIMPPLALGRLHELAVQLAGIAGGMEVRTDRRAIAVMAGDHGVVAEGVSPFPQEVTCRMVEAFQRGIAGINAISRAVGARVVVVDVGVAGDPQDLGVLVRRKVGRGTANIGRGPAMSPEQARRCVEVGIEVLEAEWRRGLDLVGTGDMGIGNTTASAAIICAISGLPPAEVVGRGAGLDDEGVRRKAAVVERALALNRPDPHDPLDVLRKVGGLEIGAIAGWILAAAARRVPVIVDGFISTAAALIAVGLRAEVRHYLIAGHLSAERGHRLALEFLGLRPLLDLGMRLGEGTGAALAFPIVDAAARLLREVATFEEAGLA